MPKTPPIGLENFAELMNGKYVFVDKTRMIQEFLDSGDKVTLIVRPRRWGKTLSLSMLQHFFSPSVHGKPTKGLFDPLKIAQVEHGKYMAHQGQYPVIFITFRTVNNISSYRSAIQRISVLLSELYREHRVICESQKLSTDEKERYEQYLRGIDVESEAILSDGLKFLSEMLYKYYDQKVIILIDEYDVPLHRAYQGNFLNEMTLFMRSLLGAALKTNDYLEKGLMTGILRLSKNQMLSDLNNLSVYTALDRKYSQHYGFSEDELRQLFSAHEVDFNAVIESVRKWYNGYYSGNLVVYNPWSVLCYLRDKVFQPYWLNTGGDALLRETFYAATESIKKKFERLLAGESVQGKIDIHVTFDDLQKNETALWSLLFFAGYVKVIPPANAQKFTSLYQLAIPNDEVAYLYHSIFQDWLLKALADDETRYDSFLKNLVAGDAEGFIKDLSVYLQASCSSYDFSFESNYHTFVLGLLASLRETHEVHSNLSSGDGRSDVLIIPKNDQDHLAIILEFKHTERGGNRTGLAKSALGQIDQQRYASSLLQRKQVTEVLKVGIAFSSRQVDAAYYRENLLTGQREETKTTEVHKALQREAPAGAAASQAKRGHRESTTLFAPVAQASSAAASSSNESATPPEATRSRAARRRK